MLWLIDIVFGGGVSLGRVHTRDAASHRSAGFAGGRQTSALRHGRPGLKCALAASPARRRSQPMRGSAADSVRCGHPELPRSAILVMS